MWRCISSASTNTGTMASSASADRLPRVQAAANGVVWRGSSVER